MGEVTSPMVYFPDDIFEDMSSLTFIHLAIFVAMPNLPSFQGVTGLKSLTLAVFLALQELPLLTNLHKLERLDMSGLVSIDSLPDLSPVQNLKSFVVSDRGTWCCHGFLGDCDLSVDKCMVHPVWGLLPPPAYLQIGPTKWQPRQPWNKSRSSQQRFVALCSNLDFWRDHQHQTSWRHATERCIDSVQERTMLSLCATTLG
ncbi:unnamed protein product [Phytophthora fragariaefolia]|uniref:Unnamed protein product n=1 Tax=Phytophthora fragariaefolia TaxID=1490495 RepID=A0A9W6Y0H8_9STRA|nr:unnamed protein product [Phytophthora fragariaefolia]